MNPARSLPVAPLTSVVHVAFLHGQVGVLARSFLPVILFKSVQTAHFLWLMVLVLKATSAGTQTPLITDAGRLEADAL